MRPALSIVICTHNPNSERLSATLRGLKDQTLESCKRECIIVDNASKIPVQVDDAEFKIVREPKLGLTFARYHGLLAAQSNLVVFVDDDNVLHRSYLERALQIFQEQPGLGAFGGKITPSWDVDASPETWIAPFYGNLAIRDLGDEVMIQTMKDLDKSYPHCAPVGAGMCVRRSALELWRNGVESNSIIADRTGASLTSGGDNDMILYAIEAGYAVGYFPELTLEHIIPRTRLTLEYQARLAEDIMKSWVLVLNKHQIRPWEPIHPMTVPLRKAKAFWRYRAWRACENHVRWRQSCGLYEGLATLWGLDK